MKGWGSYIALLSVFFVLSVSGSVHGQDAGMSDVEIVDESDPADITTIYAPGEDVRYIPKATTAAGEKDSIVLQIHDFPMQQATMRPTEDSAGAEDQEAKDDSILTFNFLYYIIQKYKLQDIID